MPAAPQTFEGHEDWVRCQSTGSDENTLVSECRWVAVLITTGEFGVVVTYLLLPVVHQTHLGWHTWITGGPSLPDHEFLAGTHLTTCNLMPVPVEKQPSCSMYQLINGQATTGIFGSQYRLEGRSVHLYAVYMRALAWLTGSWFRCRTMSGLKLQGGLFPYAV
jgi:hypothetical protein